MIFPKDPMALSSDPTLRLAQQLIRRESISPDDAGCLDLICAELRNANFNLTPLPFDDTQNLWATHGSGEPVLVLAGHTDVVPAGDVAAWMHPPFSGALLPMAEGHKLFGRGAADMKGSLAAMVIAAVNFVKANPNHQGTLAFLITSDEEASGANGTKKVVEWLLQRNEKIHYCIVGEPSSQHKLGDVVKNGRRGSLIADLRIKGKQGHVAYPHLASNPIHLATPFLKDLIAHQWDNGNAHFPPTSLQITNIHSGLGQTNVIPPHLDVQFNLRFNTESRAETIKHWITQRLNAHQLNYDIHWHLSGEPFLTEQGILWHAVDNAIRQVTGTTPEFNTTGGTSDGRFIAKMGAEIIELGGLNATIHQVNEWIRAEDLLDLEKIYRNVIQEIL